MTQRLEIDHKNGYITTFDIGMGSNATTTENYWRKEDNGRLRLISREEYSKSTSYGRRKIERVRQFIKNL